MQPDNHFELRAFNEPSSAPGVGSSPLADNPLRAANLNPRGRQNLLQRAGVTTLSTEDYSSLVNKIASRVEEGKDVVVLFSDVDGTLTPSVGNRNYRVMEQQQKAMETFKQVVAANDYIFIPITGSSYEVATRTLPGLQDRIASGEIPDIFDGLIVEGGTQAVLKTAGDAHFSYDAIYAEHVGKKIERFHARLDGLFSTCDELMAAVCEGKLGSSREKLRELDSEALKLIRFIEKKDYTSQMRIEYQPHAHPEPGTAPLDKISLYFYTTQMRDRDRIEKEFVDAFDSLNIVCCEERDFNSEAEKVLEKHSRLKKYCMDITPVNKATSIELFSRFVYEVTRAYNGINAASDKRPSTVLPVYFGDAGNDIPAARSQYIKRVGFVSGSSDELLRAADGDLTFLKESLFVDKDKSRPGVASILAALRDWKLA